MALPTVCGAPRLDFPQLPAEPGRPHNNGSCRSLRTPGTRSYSPRHATARQVGHLCRSAVLPYRRRLGRSSAKGTLRGRTKRRLAPDNLRCPFPLTTMSTRREPHWPDKPRFPTRNGGLGPIGSASSAGSGSTWWRQSRYHTRKRIWEVAAVMCFDRGSRTERRTTRISGKSTTVALYRSEGPCIGDLPRCVSGRQALSAQPVR